MATSGPRVGELPRGIVVAPSVPYPETSGGSKRTVRLLDAMDRAGAEVHFFTVGEPTAIAEDAFNDRGWHLHIVTDKLQTRSARMYQHARLLTYRHSHRLAGAVRGACADRRAAFLHAEHSGYGNYLRSVDRVPRILSTHNADGAVARAQAAAPAAPIAKLRANYHAFLWSRGERRACAAADAVLCVSSEDATHFEPLARRVVVAPNGVDDMFFSIDPTLPANDDLLFFGLMRYAPNLRGIKRFLAEGWPHFTACRPHGRLLIAGEQSSELLGEISDPRVRVLGFVDDLAAAIAQARVILVPVWEGGGTRLKVLESLAAARPLVGTVLGVSGIGFQSGVHGITADDPVELARAAVELCADDERAARLAASGRELATNYRWEQALGSAESLFRSYVEGLRSV